MTRYTSSDIEIHLSEMTEGMATDGCDVDASNTRAGALIEAAIRAAYPQYDVTVYTQQSQFSWFDAAGYPDDVEPEELEQIAEAALGDTDGSAWIVLTAASSGR